MTEGIVRCGAGKDSKDNLREVIDMLSSTNNPQSEQIMEIMQDWGDSNGVMLV